MVDHHYKTFKNKHSLGLSLVETLIAVGLLGVVLIPMLFLSSAYFLSQLTRSRENIDATHGGATFLNRFVEEAGLSQRILVGSGSGTGKSDNDAIYFAYYEPITQKSYRVGYRLTNITGGRKLERLEYNLTTSTWDVLSPYNHIKPSEVILPSTVQFQYCVDTTCASPLSGTSVENALLVRLHDTAGTGWSFTKGRQTFSLQQDTPVVLSTSIPAGQIILSDQAKEMYSIDLTQAAGSSPTETLINLNPVGGMFNYLTSTAGAGGGILSTLNPTGINSPGYANSIAVASDGRVFFGSNSTGYLYTWKNNILSTISASMTNPGQGIIVGSDDRAYFGSSARAYTWKNNVLSTLIGSDVTGIGSGYAMAVAPNGRFYIGHDHGSGLPAYTFIGTSGLTTLSPNSLSKRGIGVYESMIANPVTNGVYYGTCVWGSSTASHLVYWDGTSGSTTTIDSNSNCFYKKMFHVSALTGTVYYTPAWDYGTNGVWAWNPNGVLSTIVAPGSFGSAPGQGLMALAPNTEELYIGTLENHLLRYTPPNTLETLVTLTGYSSVGEYDGVRVMNDGRVVFSALGGGSQGRVFSWKSNVLSTITPSDAFKIAGDHSMVVDSNTGNVFFGQDEEATTTKLFWVWNSNTNVLSTILPSAVAGAVGSFSMKLGSDGRIFFGVKASGVFWTWKDNVLSTLMSANVTNPGYNSVAVTSDGRVFWGSQQASDFIRTWAPSSPTYSLNRYSNQGIKTYQTLTISSSGNHNYTYSWQDLAGDVYLLDSSGNALDRYSYSSSSQQYSYVSSLPIDSSWISNVGAMAEVPNSLNTNSSTGMAFLDSSNKRIYTYADRQATSGSATQYNLSGLSTVPTTPTGMTINRRTGDYLVLDSAVQSSGATAYVRLFVINSNVSAIKQIIPIKVNDTQYISTDLRSETNFKIQYDERKNILYLTAPSVDKTYALSLPIYL